MIKKGSPHVGDLDCRLKNPTSTLRRRFQPGKSGDIITIKTELAKCNFQNQPVEWRKVLYGMKLSGVWRSNTQYHLGNADYLLSTARGVLGGFRPKTTREAESY